MILKQCLIGVTIACAAIPAVPATASRGAISFLTPQRSIAAPRGFAVLCALQPENCTAPATHDGITTTSPASGHDWVRELRQVNREVNRHVRQRSDMARFGQRDVWQASGTGRGASGDCEDIALEKRARLIDRGFPANRLFLAVGYGRGSVGLHLLLIARTDSGDVVLDSRTSSLSLWSNAPYTWIAMQSADTPTAWFSV